jgi:hypothetical protein
MSEKKEIEEMNAGKAPGNPGELSHKRPRTLVERWASDPNPCGFVDSREPPPPGIRYKCNSIGLPEAREKVRRRIEELREKASAGNDEKKDVILKGVFLYTGLTRDYAQPEFPEADKEGIKKEILLLCETITELSQTLDEPYYELFFPYIGYFERVPERAPVTKFPSGYDRPPLGGC